ncbi:MAG: 50S ribosomal protein L9 [Actinobacteria bacterium HGW-Actinobacteria-9]|jgi:large subunit ribosomal protein L9|nr:MAG: 50S ribosomal protein L9 [Actinobacteria bacterium HGW-Actinobacteria-9]
MKVILTQEVKGKGGEGDVIDVATGYAVNYLFPRKMAIDATPGNLKQLELRKHNINAREEARLGDASGVAAALQGKAVTIEAKVGEEGRLFGSITSQMIEEAISEQLDVVVDRKKMDVHGVIKQVGAHPVSVSVYRDVKATITVNVVGEGGTAAPAAVEAEPIQAQDASDIIEVEEAALEGTPEAEEPGADVTSETAESTEEGTEEAGEEA